MIITGYTYSPDETSIVEHLTRVVEEAKGKGFLFTFDYNDGIITISVNGSKLSVFANVNDTTMYLLGFVSALNVVTIMMESDE